MILCDEPAVQGMLTFEKDAYFSGNLNDNLYYGSGPGGAISNHVKGTIHFMGKLTMENNIADVRNQWRRATRCSASLNLSQLSALVATCRWSSFHSVLSSLVARLSFLPIYIDSTVYLMANHDHILTL